MGASSRLRIYQYIPLWVEQGIQTKISSFFNEKYLSEVYKKKKVSKLNVLSCYVRRFLMLCTAFRYDLIWLEKEAFPFLPSYAEWLLAKLGNGYIVDYDDAVFHNYEHHPHWLVRHWMGNKIDLVMRKANLVMAGNSYLRERAIAAGAKQLVLSPTVVNLAKYRKVTSAGVPIRIGWIGSPTTIKYLHNLPSVFEELKTMHEFELVIINASDTDISDFSCTTRLVSWTEDSQYETLADLDIGIMPLPDNLWERGKCAYKLIQYMASGLPVVASPVGMNNDVVQHGVNGYLANSPREWVEYLSELIAKPAEREAMGKEGRALVEREYTLEGNFEKIKKIVVSRR